MPKRQKRYLAALFVMVSLLIVIGCRASVKTLNPEEEKRFTAEYSYTDLQKLSAEMASRIMKTKMAEENPPAVVIIYGIDNQTTEHINTQALANAIRGDLMKSGKFQFVNEAQRQKVVAEIAYQNQGYITPETRIKIGKQVGAKYMLTGQLIEIKQEELKQWRATKKSLRYYRLTLEITDLDTNLIIWTDEQEIVREQARPFIGW